MTNILEELKEKKIAVLGLGIEGVAVIEFLRGKVDHLTILDQSNADKLRQPGDLADKINNILDDDSIEKILGDNYLEALDNFDVIFRTPGISILNPKLQQALKSGVTVTSQIKLFFDLCPCQIIGVTGTKGKGTTASLICEIIKKENKRKVFIAGNIGYFALSLLDKVSSDDVFILELSSFQLMDLHKSPHIAVVTNLEQEHLNYHQDLNEYFEAKFNILAHQSTSDYAVLNLSSTFDSELLDTAKGKIKYFSKTADATANAILRPISDGEYEVVINPGDHEEVICKQSEIQLLGRHNLENIAAAALVAEILGIDFNIVRSAVREFKGLPYRLELVATIDGVKYINDSFGTNPEPTMAAIRSFTKDKILILGGSSKGADFADMARETASSNVKAVIEIGLEGPKIKAALEAAGYKGQIIEGADNIKAIIHQAKDTAKSGDVVIFSPACASFDMFKDYKDRGKRFTEAVRELKNK